MSAAIPIDREAAWVSPSAQPILLLQTLLANDLIDEFRLLIYPLVLGKGKRLFGDGTLPAAFKLVKSSTSPSGVLIATYERAGDIQIGSFDLLEHPTELEIERRKQLQA